MRRVARGAWLEFSGACLLPALARVVCETASALLPTILSVDASIPNHRPHDPAETGGSAVQEWERTYAVWTHRGTLIACVLAVCSIGIGFWAPPVFAMFMWLNKRGLDVRCIRLCPYKMGDKVLVDATQIIPLPEAADYEVKLREQTQETKKLRSKRQDG
mgnify:CR=1 FL=1